LSPAVSFLLSAGALFVTLIVGAYTDIARGKVYNWCTYPAMFVGLSLSYIFGGPKGLIWAVIGLALGVAVFILPYCFRLVGGGDVKLMGAVGALVGGWGFYGLNLVLLCAFLSTVVGAIFGLSILIWKGKLKGALGNMGSAMFTPWRLKNKPGVDETRVPYGAAIALGTFWAWFAMMGIL
jgi:prepilin peptidase CpaA